MDEDIGGSQTSCDGGILGSVPTIVNTLSRKRGPMTNLFSPVAKKYGMGRRPSAKHDLKLGTTSGSTDSPLEWDRNEGGFHNINSMGYVALPPSKGLSSLEFTKGWEKFVMFKHVAYLWSDGWALGRLQPIKGEKFKIKKGSMYDKEKKQTGANFWVKYDDGFYLQKIDPQNYLNGNNHPDDSPVGTWCLLQKISKR